MKIQGCVWHGTKLQWLGMALGLQEARVAAVRGETPEATEEWTVCYKRERHCHGACSLRHLIRTVDKSPSRGCNHTEPTLSLPLLCLPDDLTIFLHIPWLPEILPALGPLPVACGKLCMLLLSRKVENT